MRKELQIFTRDIAHQCAAIERAAPQHSSVHAIAILTGKTHTAMEPGMGSRDTVLMSDTWLSQVANMARMSDAGLYYLANALETQGYITLDNACTWLSMEREADRLCEHKPVVYQTTPASTGAQQVVQLAQERQMQNTGVQSEKQKAALLRFPRKSAMQHA